MADTVSVGNSTSSGTTGTRASSAYTRGRTRSRSSSSRSGSSVPRRISEVRRMAASAEDCIFCKIVRREMPASVVREDDSTLAFLDIRPMNPGHVLVIPKTHAVYVEDLSPRGGAETDLDCGRHRATGGSQDARNSTASLRRSAGRSGLSERSVSGSPRDRTPPAVVVRWGRGSSAPYGSGPKGTARGRSRGGSPPGSPTKRVVDPRPGGRL